MTFCSPSPSHFKEPHYLNSWMLTPASPRWRFSARWFLLLLLQLWWHLLPCEWLVRAQQPLPGQRHVCTRRGHGGTPEWSTSGTPVGQRWSAVAQHRIVWSPVGEGHEAPRVLSILWRVGQTEADLSFHLQHLLISACPLICMQGSHKPPSQEQFQCGMVNRSDVYSLTGGRCVRVGGLNF